MYIKAKTNRAIFKKQNKTRTTMNIEKSEKGIFIFLVYSRMIQLRELLKYKII